MVRGRIGALVTFPFNFPFKMTSVAEPIKILLQAVNHVFGSASGALVYDVHLPLYSTIPSAVALLMAECTSFAII